MNNVITTILSSPYGKDTLVLLTWDEGGGLFDHVTPPGTSAVDSQPYGTRIPLLAMGPFAKTNYVSHVTMEHSSIVKFLEWNFTGETGQLGARDAVVANLGDLLDPAKTGIPVPAN
jgi:phospholipase C